MARREGWLPWLGLLGAILMVWGCDAIFPRQPLPPPPLPPPQAVPMPPSRPSFYINASRVNLRACPGMDCPKIFALERNEEVEKVGESDDWSQVRVKRDGSIGWVASRFLAREPAAAEAPPPPLPPAVRPPAPEAARPERPPVPEGPPLPEKPRPLKPPEASSRPAEAAEPAPPAAKPGRPAETPVPAKKPPAEEKPAPPAEPPAEPQKRIRIM